MRTEMKRPANRGRRRAPDLTTDMIDDVHKEHVLKYLLIQYLQTSSAAT